MVGGRPKDTVDLEKRVPSLSRRYGRSLALHYRFLKRRHVNSRGVLYQNAWTVHQQRRRIYIQVKMMNKQSAWLPCFSQPWPHVTDFASKAT
jgi:hypothetical protein